jgi:uncharacterized Ntn-hydrolase superfamily protein
MTWSLIALDSRTGELGIAVATRFFAAGARVPFIAPDVGAIATQALVNPYYGIDGLELLRAGASPEQALSALLREDPGRDHRQVHVVNCNGRAAAHTGSSCLAWAGHRLGDGISLAGNMLAGPEVLERTAATYLEQAHLPLAQRLILAMQAGEAAGGDRRGKQSAAILIFDKDEWSSLDIRVDDHADPLSELARLESVSRMEWVSSFRPYPRQSGGRCRPRSDRRGGRRTNAGGLSGLW